MVSTRSSNSTNTSPSKNSERKPIRLKNKSTSKYPTYNKDLSKDESATQKKLTKDHAMKFFSRSLEEPNFCLKTEVLSLAKLIPHLRYETVRYHFNTFKEEYEKNVLICEQEFETSIALQEDCSENVVGIQARNYIIRHYNHATTSKHRSHWMALEITRIIHSMMMVNGFN